LGIATMAVAGAAVSSTIGFGGLLHDSVIVVTHPGRVMD
jgi:hypothetical protein